MMYIRTKYGVYENAHPYFTEDNKVYMRWDYPSNIELKFLGDIIKQADTIEELCDEFVGVDKTCENGHQLLRAIPYKCANFWNGGVYGAVWVDGKGLIYVAKMNEKGELELI